MQRLTASQISILLLLDQKGALKVSDVASELGMVNSNASNVCSRLEKAGLVARNRNQDDQRVVKVHLTRNAELKMGDIKASVDQFYNRMRDHVAKADLEDIRVGLTKLNALFDMFLEAMQEGVKS